MIARINGEPRDLPDGLTIGSLLELLGAARVGIAIARNDTIVRRVTYDTQSIFEGDRIEIIRAVTGG